MNLTLSVGVISLCMCFGFYIWHTRRIRKLESSHNIVLEQYKERLSQQNIALQKAQNEQEILQSQMSQRLQDMHQMHQNALLEEKAHSQAMLQNLKEQFIYAQNEQEKLKEQNKQELQNAFKALSADILAQNTQSFNQNQILSLQPLRDEIQRFTKQLSLNHETNLKQHTSLETQIHQLHKLNLQLSTDAHNLTNALKGENKIQGNWGEVILQRVLENSGLQQGREYEIQQTLYDDSSNLLRPDAIIKLPKHNEQERCVVVDSKTSLIAYERLCNAENEEDKILARKELALSIQSHINALSGKNYQQYLQGQKLDFVLMFVPIEGAFLEAMQYDMSLYDKAYQKGVVLVSPTTIMAVLRIIHNLWQFEHRNKNVDKIFNEIQKLFVYIERFENTLDKLGKNINTLQKTFTDDVMVKYNGTQGIANKSENIQKLLKGAGVDMIDQDTLP